jgi:hypothetical protein
MGGMDEPIVRLPVTTKAGTMLHRLQYETSSLELQDNCDRLALLQIVLLLALDRLRPIVRLAQAMVLRICAALTRRHESALSQIVALAVRGGAAVDGARSVSTSFTRLCDGCHPEY